MASQVVCVSVTVLMALGVLVVVLMLMTLDVFFGCWRRPCVALDVGFQAVCVRHRNSVLACVMSRHRTCPPVPRLSAEFRLPNTTDSRRSFPRTLFILLPWCCCFILGTRKRCHARTRGPGVGQRRESRRRGAKRRRSSARSASCPDIPPWSSAIPAPGRVRGRRNKLPSVSCSFFFSFFFSVWVSRGGALPLFCGME